VRPILTVRVGEAREARSDLLIRDPVVSVSMASGVAVRSLAASLRTPWVKRGQSHDVAPMGYLVREHLYLRPHGSYLVTARPLCATRPPAPLQPTTRAHPCVTALPRCSARRTWQQSRWR